jgi:3alpha(or 20beta)-hydroxysteroid dehydrogenase
VSAPGARLEAKIVLITGAGGGIGAAAARRFATEGATLILSDAEPAGAELLAQEIGAGAGAVTLDVTSETAWAAVVEQALASHGRIDVLLNNAGIFLARSLTETSPEDFRRVLDVNLTGVFLGMRALAPSMSERKAGSIINVSSVAGLMGGPYLAAYSASKWGVRGITKVAARELARSGVRVNSVHPGQIDTAMNARQAAETPELIERLIKGIPMGRIGTPEEVAEALVYLASDESRYTTGAELALDGGVTA